jgi:hypothetical protein
MKKMSHHSKTIDHGGAQAVKPPLISLSANENRGQGHIAHSKAPHRSEISKSKVKKDGRKKKERLNKVDEA